MNEEQIVFPLRQAQAGTRIEEAGRKFGASQAKFYNWERKYGGLGVSELVASVVEVRIRE